MDLEVIKPFGPSIVKLKLPEKIGVPYKKGEIN